MEFTKMHGLGNDFIIVNNLDSRHQEKDFSRLAVSLCLRKFGIGADGLVVLAPSSRASFRMQIFNPDGSEAEMCGNAIRCLARFAREHGLVEEDSFSFETGAGLKPVWLTLRDSAVVGVKVDMGAPILESDRVPVKSSSSQAVNERIEVDGRELFFTAVSMGNPHCVIFVPAADSLPWEELGRKIEKSSFFPNRTNVEFVEMVSRDEVKVKVWERGAGPTLACGTGACATLVAGVLTGKLNRTATVHLPGGSLDISWSDEDGHVYMEGPAEEVFKGETTG